MNKFTRISSIFAIMAVIIGCAPRGESPEQMIAAAKALDQQFATAYNNGDVDGVMATYWNSPDLVSFPPGTMEARGWQAVKDDLAQFLASAPGLKLELLEANYKVVGEVVLGYGKWRATIPAGGDNPVVLNGRYSDVHAKRNGKWVYIMDHASVPLPPAEKSPTEK